MDFILSKIISRPKSAPESKASDKKDDIVVNNGVESPQKSQPESLLLHETEILKKIPAEPQQTVEVLNKSPEISIDNSRQEVEEKKEDFDEQYRECGANYSALSSDDEAFVECHSYIADQTVDIVLNETVDVKQADEDLSKTFDNETDSNISKKVDVNLIARDFVDEIVSRAITLIPENTERSPEVNKSLNLDSSQEDSLNITVEEKECDQTLIIDKPADKKINLDDEINKLTETLSQIKIPTSDVQEVVAAEELCVENFNGTFDVSMKDIENLNETFETATETGATNSGETSRSEEESTLELIQESVERIEDNSKIPEAITMPETDEHNLSRNESFEEASLRDSPKTSSVTSSLNSLTVNPESNNFVENLITENVDFAFKMPEVPTDTKRKNLFGNNVQENPSEMCFGDNDNAFRPSSDFEFTQSDLDYLLTKGNDCNSQIDRNSLLLRFDPLLNQPVPIGTSQLKASFNRQEQKGQSIREEEEEEEEEIEILGDTPNLEDTVAPCMSENDELGCITSSDNSHVATTSCEYAKDLNSESDSYKDCVSQASSDATMSIDVIKDVAADEVKINSEESFKKEYKMAELEKKIKNEVLKTEDIEKKLKEAEAREEALLKRITENQKTITKMTGVLEAYEKSIAELIAEKQQIIESYEKKCADLQHEKNLNYLHLNSLEGTFSDLHVKYERSKQVTLLLKKSEESLIAEKKQYQENLRVQEQRYEKMKSHAMQQLELANNKLDTLAKQHSQETAKLKALLKKEEISRLSTNEQLLQKTRENEELVKICDELISGSTPSS
ncbi:hypothetical protein DMENIID0001_026370 [Sergentomyia squamirostris]